MAAHDARKRPINIAEKARCKPGSLVLVPPRGILEIGLGKWPNDEPACQGRLVAAVQLLTS